jgi:hypothetical protein
MQLTAVADGKTTHMYEQAVAALHRFEEQYFQPELRELAPQTLSIADMLEGPDSMRAFSIPRETLQIAA